MGYRQCRHHPPRSVLVPMGDGGRVIDPESGEWYILLPPAHWWTEGVCEYGTCVEYNCPVCGCFSHGHGLSECPCSNETGYHDMRRATCRLPLKPAHLRGHRYARRR